MLNHHYKTCANGNIELVPYKNVDPYQPHIIGGLWLITFFRFPRLSQGFLPSHLFNLILINLFAVIIILTQYNENRIKHADRIIAIIITIIIVWWPSQPLPLGLRFIFGLAQAGFPYAGKSAVQTIRLLQSDSTHCVVN